MRVQGLVVCVILFTASSCGRALDALTGSGGSSVPGPPADVGAGSQVHVMYEANPVRRLDLVFVIDNASTMAEEQAGFGRAIPALLRELESIPGGLPDLRVAVVSTNVGAGQNQPSPGCPPVGDRGRFQVRPDCGLDPNARFLTVEGSGRKNFSGELATTLACLSSLGVKGCPYRHSLQALRASLLGVNDENRGFLREDATLGIVIVSDRDDCSADIDADLFDAPFPAGGTASLRCATVGHRCGAAPVPAEAGFRAPLASCHPVERKPEQRRSHLINVQEIVDSLKDLKRGRPDRIVVAAIGGWEPSPEATYAVDQLTRAVGEPRTELDVAPICRSRDAEATPALRLKAFVDAFGDNGTFESLCQDPTPSLRSIGRLLVSRIANTCLAAPLFDADPARPALQPDCQVLDRVPKSGGYQDSPLPACGGGQAPCWNLVTDASCGAGYRVEIDRGGTLPPPGTLVAITCRGATRPSGGCPPDRCPAAGSASHGQPCDVGTAVAAPANQAVWRGDAAECSGRLCARFARDSAVAAAIDTTAVCTRVCNSDADCAGGDLRMPSLAADKRCRSGFTCGVAFEVGPLRCQKVCVCKDFLVIPPGGLQTPASCAGR